MGQEAEQQQRTSLVSAGQPGRSGNLTNTLIVNGMLTWAPVDKPCPEAVPYRASCALVAPHAHQARALWHDLHLRRASASHHRGVISAVTIGERP